MPRCRLLICAFVISAAAWRSAQAQQPVTADDRERIVAEICGLLREHYVFPRIAEAIVDTLQGSLDRGRYDSATDNEILASLLTEDLRSVNRDLHLRADFLEPGNDGGDDEPDWPRIFLNHIFNDKQTNYGIVSVRRFDGNIGYIELTKLKPLNRESKRIITAAMDFSANADALIIDLRRNTGGSTEMIEFLTSCFFAGRVPLVGRYERATGGVRESATSADFDGPRLVDMPLFLLTSGRTISAPEGFVYNLQVLERATVIGETTAGAANPGRFFRIREKIQLLVATGYAEHPLTGASWEGSGVIPDVQVPASEALDRALELAQEAAAAYRQKKEGALEEYIGLLSRQISDVEALAARDPGAAGRMMDQIADQWFGQEFMNRYFFLELGDQYRGRLDDTMAGLVYRQVPRYYPDYVTGYRKLAELHFAAGDWSSALKYLTKILELDPNDRDTFQKISVCHEKQGVAQGTASRP